MTAAPLFPPDEPLDIRARALDLACALVGRVGRSPSGAAQIVECARVFEDYLAGESRPAEKKVVITGAPDPMANWSHFVGPDGSPADRGVSLDQSRS
jgi:hypothetical protein